MDDESSDQPHEPDGELASLRSEVEELRRRNAELVEDEEPRRRWLNVLRGVAIVVLITLGAVCVTASVPAIWSRNLVLNTDRYVQTLTPLASDPGMQRAVVKAVDDQFQANIDVSALVRQALPGRAGKLLAGPLGSAAQSLVNTIATKFVHSRAFVTLWISINRTAHTALVDIVTGNHPTNDAVTVRNGVLTLDLAPIVTAVKAQLVHAGLAVATRVPSVGATIEIAQVKGLTKVQGYVRLLNDVAHWLPVVALLCFGAAVVAATRRRRAVLWSALSAVIGMLLIAIGLAIGRSIYLSDLPLHYLTASDAGRLFDTLVRFLRAGLRLVMVVALLIAAIAWLTGPSRSARAIRSRASRAASLLTHHWPDSHARSVLGDNRSLLSGVVIGVAALVLVFWTNPSAFTVLVVAVITAATVLALYSLRPRPPSSAGPAT